MTLGTKSEFGRFFANLVEDARQGKGLQEVAKAWNEDNGLEIWGESEAYEDMNGTDGDESQQVENVQLGNEDWTEVGSVQDISPGSPSVEAPIEEEPAATAGTGETDTTKVPDSAEEGVLSNEPSEPQTETHAVEPAKPEANGNGEEEEEGGDFLDYDDEDYAQGGDGVEPASKQDKAGYDQPGMSGFNPTLCQTFIF